jgi:cell division protein FtsZ
VPGDGIAASSDLAAEAGPASADVMADEMPERSERPERVAVATDGGDSHSRTFDVTAARRRPVVFEEDDDLDVPDFLK